MRDNIYALYLKVGHIDEILNMSYWRFRDIIETWVIIERRKMGLPVVRKLRKSNKDLINNLKRLKDGKN